MKILKGDLITYALGGRFNCIVHGCNCFNKFGKGIALSIRKIFPEAYVADLKTIEGDKNKLGTISYATVKGGGDNKLIVVNAYTQYNYGTDRQQVDYDALRSCFKEVKRLFGDKVIGYPKIGAGLAQGRWDIIAPIIDEELTDCNHSLVVLKDDKIFSDLF